MPARGAPERLPAGVPARGAPRRALRRGPPSALLPDHDLHDLRVERGPGRPSGGRGAAAADPAAAGPATAGGREPGAVRRGVAPSEHVRQRDGARHHRRLWRLGDALRAHAPPPGRVRGPRQDKWGPRRPALLHLIGAPRWRYWTADLLDSVPPPALSNLQALAANQSGLWPSGLQLVAELHECSVRCALGCNCSSTFRDDTNVTGCPAGGVERVVVKQPPLMWLLPLVLASARPRFTYVHVIRNGRQMSVSRNNKPRKTFCAGYYGSRSTGGADPDSPAALRGVDGEGSLCGVDTPSRLRFWADANLDALNVLCAQPYTSFFVMRVDAVVALNGTLSTRGEQDVTRFFRREVAPGEFLALELEATAQSLFHATHYLETRNETLAALREDSVARGLMQALGYDVEERDFRPPGPFPGKARLCADVRRLLAARWP